MDEGRIRGAAREAWALMVGDPPMPAGAALDWCRERADTDDVRAVYRALCGAAESWLTGRLAAPRAAVPPPSFLSGAAAHIPVHLGRGMYVTADLLAARMRREWDHNVLARRDRRWAKCKEAWQAWAEEVRRAAELVRQLAAHADV